MIVKGLEIDVRAVQEREGGSEHLRQVEIMVGRPVYRNIVREESCVTDDGGGWEQK